MRGLLLFFVVLLLPGALADGGHVHPEPSPASTPPAVPSGPPRGHAFLSIAPVDDATTRVTVGVVPTGGPARVVVRSHGVVAYEGVPMAPVLLAWDVAWPSATREIDVAWSIGDAGEAGGAFRGAYDRHGARARALPDPAGEEVAGTSLRTVPVPGVAVLCLLLAGSALARGPCARRRG